MTDQAPTGHTLTDAEVKDVRWVLQHWHPDHDEGSRAYEVVARIKADAYAAGLAARGGNTDNTLRARIEALAEAGERDGRGNSLALARQLRAALDAGPGGYTCPTACVEQNHPGREHDDWLAAPAPTEDRMTFAEWAEQYARTVPEPDNHHAAVACPYCIPAPLPLHRTEAGYPRCSTCDGGGCPDCTDPA